MRIRVLVLVLAMLSSVACSGGSSLVSTTEQAGGDLPDAGEIAGVIVSNLGPDAGFDATALAFDSGYLVEQIASDAGRLEASGSIPGTAPAGTDHGLFGESPGAAGTVVLAAGATLAAGDDDALEAFGDAFARDADVLFLGEEEVAGQNLEGSRLVALLLGLVDGGYSIEQIVEGLILGEVTMTSGVVDHGDEEGYRSCLALVDVEGVLVAPALLDGVPPALRSSSECRDAIREGRLLVGSEGTPVATTAPVATTPSESVAIVYRGDGVHVLTTYYSGDDITVACETPGPMELRLDPNGVATFTYFNGVGLNNRECEPRAGNAWTGSFDVETSTFVVDQPAAGLDGWDFEGIFNSELALGSGTYSYTSTVGEDYVTSTIEIDFTLQRAR